MRHAMTRVLLLVGALMALAYPAHAQPVQGLAVAACGTPGITITAGTPGPFTVDTTGKLCDSSSGGGGGGLSVVDQTAWVQGTSAFTPTGCVFNDTATLSSGQEGTVRCTTDRQFKVLDSAAVAAINSPVTDCGATPCANRIGEIWPLQGTSTQTKVTITTASTYQQYLASNTSRKGCTIQFITAAHTGYVFFGASPADTTTSFQLSPGQSISCTNGNGVVLTDAIQLTSSNNSDVFIVNSF